MTELAGELNIPPESILPDQTLLSLGIDSIRVVAFVAKLEERCGIRFSENPLDDHPTITALSQHVANLMGGAA
ncbi:MAG: acyl carrier protein [Planctomycetaceae bacterium]